MLFLLTLTSCQNPFLPYPFTTKIPFSIYVSKPITTERADYGLIGPVGTAKLKQNIISHTISLKIYVQISR